MNATSTPALAVVTRRVAQVEDLIALLPAAEAAQVSTWVRRGEGVVGVGRAWSVGTQGPTRMEDADTEWRALVSAAVVDDEVRLPGSGLIALGSFAFHDDSPAGGVLTVPEVSVGRRDGHAWITLAQAAQEGEDPYEVASTLRARLEDALAEDSPLAALGLRGPQDPPAQHPGEISERDGVLDQQRWHEAVAAVVARIGAGEVEKVVLARDVLATTENPLDVRHLLGRLAQGYPNTWCFAVDGLVGATPEMLVRRDKGLAAARVLAGTVPTAGDGQDDLRVAQALAGSSKDLGEHALAVASLVQALEPYCTSMNVPDEPFVLRLPNVMHLASDVTGAVRTVDGLAPSSLVLAEALHPTAAVGGTPTPEAVDIIADCEEDRGRYAGPVGWISADGDGEWGIALRCGAVQGERTIRLHAGCGIVGASVPQEEYAESEAKLAPLRWALQH